MVADRRFYLEKSSRKHTCPGCGKKRFVRFVDEVTNDYLPEIYGRCDREANCGYFGNPYSDGYIKSLINSEKNGGGNPLPKYRTFTQRVITEKIRTDFDFETFKKTLKGYDQNVFIQNLLHRVPFPLEVEDVKKLIHHYRLGTVTNGYMTGAITFPFIDFNGIVRAVQVKKFNELNKTVVTDFLHSIIEKKLIETGKEIPQWLKDYKSQDKRVSCLFGEHLLRSHPRNPIALVEAPKTAVYSTLYFGLPKSDADPIWLAVYNLSSFKYDKIKILRGRKIFVFPDLSKDGATFQKWKNNAQECEAEMPGTQFIFSDLLERFAPDENRENGDDLADFIIKQDWRMYRTKKEYSDYTREERIIYGLQKFKKDELSEFISQLFENQNIKTIYEIREFLGTEGLSGNDCEDLMDILCIKKILTAMDFPNYQFNPEQPNSNSKIHLIEKPRL